MDQYLRYWNISAPVFAPAHGHLDFYLPERLARSVERIDLFCKQEQTLIAISGESGTGKTSLTRWLHDTIATDTHDFLLTTLLHEELYPGWLMPRIAEYLGVVISADMSVGDLTQAVGGRLDTLMEEKTKLLIAIDAAHLIRNQGWQDIIGLLNLGSLVGSCFSFLLVGRDELTTHISQVEGLQSKLSCKLSWSAFTQQETAGYIAFRCEQAGFKNPFKDESIAYIQQLTSGVASAINAVCENALIEAHQLKTRVITLDVARAAGHYIPGVQPSTPSLPTTPSDSQPAQDLGDKPETGLRIQTLTKDWVPPPPEKPRSHESNPNATIRMTSLFKSRNNDSDK